MKTYYFKSILILSFSVGMISAKGPKGPSYYDIRSMGMGNTTVAVTTDRTAIYHNPAGLSLIKEDVDISISPLAAAIDGRLFTLIRAMADNKVKLSNLSNIDAEFINTINDLDGEWVGIEYLPEISVAAHNIGFGIYSVLPINMKIESGHLIPKLGLQGQQDLVFTWAVGVPLKSEKNHCGISVEYLQRTPLQETITSYSQTFILFDDISSGKFFGVLGDYSKIKHGVSFDVGFMHDFSGFRLAYDFKDILGIVGGDMVFPPCIDLGCAYFFPQLRKYSYIENFIIAMEFSNIVGFEPVTGKYEQFWKKTHFGLEFDVKYAAFRLGLNQGYPTAGMGIKAGFFKVDYVFFQEETGFWAGQRVNQKHVLSLSFNFKVKKNKNATNTQDNGLPPGSSKEIKNRGTINEDNPSSVSTEKKDIQEAAPGISEAPLKG